MKILCGIHLGTHSSAIALMQLNEEGKVENISDGYEVICNEYGDRSIPSVIAYSGDDILIGSTAIAQKARNPQNTISNFLSLLGPQVDDEKISALKSRENFRFSSGAFELTIGEETRRLTPKEIMADFLKQLKRTIDSYSGDELVGAVLTVPQGFTAIQDLSEACKDAALPLIHTVNDSVAVLHSLKLVADIESSGSFVVVNGGSQSTAVSHFVVRSGTPVLVKYVELGNVSGSEIDNVLAVYFADEFMRKYKADPREARRSMVKLRIGVEQVKKTLSMSQNAYLMVESLHEGIDFNSNLHRIKFESLCFDLFSKFKKQLLEFKQTLNADLLAVFVTGGLSCVPKVVDIVGQVFADLSVVKDPIPLESAAVGAVIEAASIYSVTDGQASYDYIQNAAKTTPAFSPYKIGIEIICDDGKKQSTPLVDLYQPLPYSKTVEIQPEHLNCKSFTIGIMDLLNGTKIGDFAINKYDPESLEVFLNCELSIERKLSLLLETSSGLKQELRFQ